jgi:hypothetical protein
MSETRTPLQNHELWKLLVDTVHSLPMYKHHKRYVQDVMLKEKPGISAQELAVQINIPLGEAIVLLDELRGPSASQSSAGSGAPSGKTVNRTLLDFDG